MFQFGMTSPADLIRNTRLAVEMKIRLDNQFQVSQRKMQIDTQAEFDAQKNMAILLRRLAINIDNKLIPAMTQHMEKNQEIKRFMKIMQPIP